ncbi:MAG: hypothetical protein U7127_11310 [Phormidium sp.]
MGLTINLLSAMTLILGIQLINIHAVTAASVDIHGLIKTMDYEPPDKGGPDSNIGSGTR